MVAVLLLTGGLAASSFSATEPTPGPSQPVREQNLDGSGAIRVHEQGTAKVEVTNSSLAVTGTVSLGNSALDVNVLGGSVDAHVSGGSVDANVTGGSVTAKVSPASAVFVRRNLTVPPDFGEQTLTFPTINASAIYAHSTNDAEVQVRFDSPLATDGLFYLGDTTSAQLSRVGIMTFYQPIPINGIHILCGNSDFDCALDVTVIGTAAE